MPVADVLLPWLPLETAGVVFTDRSVKIATRASLGSADVLPWLSLG